MGHIATADELRNRNGRAIGAWCDAVRSARDAHWEAAQQIERRSTITGREFVKSEERAHRAHLDEVEELAKLLDSIESLPEAQQVDRSQVIVATGSGLMAGYHAGGGHTYNQGDPHTSWVRDMVAGNLRGDGAAVERLRRNNEEVTLETRALSNTATAGGEWVPPLWLVTEGLRLARAGRVVADQIGHMDLPPGTDSISLPRVATGTAVDLQATENTAVQETDATTGSITADVATIAGQQTLSVQMVDQSPAPIDRVILQDLLAALAVRTDTFVISNNATNKVGLLSVSGLNSVTYTDASPTVAELYPKVADAIQRVHTGRYLPPSRIFMHPRRWAWFTAAADTTGRPLVVPVAQMPQNVAAAMGDVTSEGFVGSLQGLPVYVDANIPINLGLGTDEDRIIITRAEDQILMESLPHANVFREPLAAQLSVLLVVHRYVALHASRYPKSISVISGTGLVTPTF